MIFLAHCWWGIKAQIYRYASVLDIEECATETDNCHVDANCTNTKGSFYCTCHTGYSGDGVICKGKAQSRKTETQGKVTAVK